MDVLMYLRVCGITILQIKTDGWKSTVLLKPAGEDYGKWTHVEDDFMAPEETLRQISGNVGIAVVATDGPHQ
jgi:hypothetical protein